MRRAFVDELTKIATRNKKVMLLTADLGYMVLEPFRDKLPKQFLNVGVMEQNMVGVATGLAMNGFIPFIYSITTFATLRAIEFIRNGPMAHDLPVRVVGIGSGVEYAFDGLSHHSYEDVGIMRMLPNVSIISPADNNQMKTALRKTWNLHGPVYYRVSKNENPDVPGLNGAFEYNQVDILRKGKDAVIFASGSMVYQALQCAEELSRTSIACEVVALSTLHPVQETQIAAVLKRHRLAVTMEAHYATGGIGTIVSEVATSRGIPIQVLRRGLTYEPLRPLGHPEYYYKLAGLDVKSVVASIKKHLKKA